MYKAIIYPDNNGWSREEKIQIPDVPKNWEVHADTKEELAHELMKLLSLSSTFEEFKRGYKVLTNVNKDGVKVVLGEYYEGGKLHDFIITDKQGKTVSLFD